MANSKLGWCEYLVKIRVFTRKVINHGNKKLYKYYDSDGVQIKAERVGACGPVGALKHELHRNLRSYNRRQLYAAVNTFDTESVPFESSPDRFSDMWHWD